MANDLEPFLRFSNGILSQDGMQVRLRVETANVPPLDIAMHYGEIASMVEVSR